MIAREGQPWLEANDETLSTGQCRRVLNRDLCLARQACRHHGPVPGAHVPCMEPRDIASHDRSEADDGEDFRRRALTDGLTEMFGLNCRVLTSRAAPSLLDRRPDPGRLLGQSAPP